MIKKAAEFTKRESTTTRPSPTNPATKEFAVKAATASPPAVLPSDAAFLSGNGLNAAVCLLVLRAEYFLSICNL